MTVYHGSYVEVKYPKISFSRENLDFGKGFYVTPIINQAASWADRFKHRQGKSILNFYRYEDLHVEAKYNIKVFEHYDEEWLDYIFSCRNGKHTKNYDVVMGGVANDKVFNTIELYFKELINKEEAIKRLRYEKPNFQICILNQEILDKYLFFEKSEDNYVSR